MNPTKMNSFSNTEEVMVRNEAVWKEDTDVENAFKAIKLKLPMVNKYHQNQKKNGNVASTVKTDVKKQLIPMAIKISVSAISYAVSQNDLTLEMSVKLTKSDLESMSQITLYDTLTLFYDKVLPLKSFLKHLEATDIEKLDQLLKSFKTSIPKPGADSDESQTATQNIGETIKQLNELFKTLDKHIAPYAYTYPYFFNDYKNSRKVIDLKGKAKAKKAKKANGEVKTA